MAVLLTSACTGGMICPAYQSSFILDEDYRRNYFSPFEVNAGDTVPKGYQANASDTVFNSTFYAQRGERPVQQKEGFTYPNRKKKFFLARIWSSPERPVLENPYLLDRILKKRPYWKLDILKPELVHSSNTDTVQLEVPMLIDSLGRAVPDTTRTESDLPTYNVLTVPERYKGYNVDQIEYNRKFGHLFPKPPPPPEPDDSVALLAAEKAAQEADTLQSKKKGLRGLFKKKSKSPKKKGDDDGTGADEGAADTTDAGGAGNSKLSKKERKAGKKKDKAKDNENKKKDKAKSKKKDKEDDKKGKKKEGNEDGVRDEDDAESFF